MKGRKGAETRRCGPGLRFCCAFLRFPDENVFPKLHLRSVAEAKEPIEFDDSTRQRRSWWTARAVETRNLLVRRGTSKDQMGQLWGVVRVAAKGSTASLAFANKDSIPESGRHRRATSYNSCHRLPRRIRDTEIWCRRSDGRSQKRKTKLKRTREIAVGEQSSLCE